MRTHTASALAGFLLVFPTRMSAHASPTDPPAITMTAPRSGAYILGTVPISVYVTHGAATIDHVTIYWNAGLNLLADLPGPARSADKPPYAFYSTLWDSNLAPGGVMQLVAYAYDTSGGVGSAYVNVSVTFPDKSTCIASGLSQGDLAAIQAALTGPDAQAVLCPNQTYFLTD